MSRSRYSSITAVTAKGTAVRGVLSRANSKQSLAVPEAPQNLPQRVSNSVIGVKGSFLKDSKKVQEVEENPMARLKLLLVRSVVLVYLLGLKRSLVDCFIPYPPHPQLHDDPNSRSNQRSPPEIFYAQRP